MKMTNKMNNRKKMIIKVVSLIVLKRIIIIINNININKKIINNNNKNINKKIINNNNINKKIINNINKKIINNNNNNKIKLMKWKIMQIKKEIKIMKKIYSKI